MNFSILMLTAFIGSESFACSAFCLSGREKVIVGKSYDWFFGHGHGAIYTNPAGTARKVLIFDDNAPNPARWVSKFGSVTFTQFGRGLPISGMNDKGLVVELLQSEEANYNSTQTHLPYVNESQWSQYQLDSFASVDEVLAHIHELRIDKAYTGIHYFLADKSGRSAAVDFVNGEVVVHTGADLPVPVLTNDPYAHLIQYLNEHPATPSSSMIGRLSEVRFQRAKIFTDQVSSTPDDGLKDLAWRAMETVRLNGLALDAFMEPSQWNIIYDVTAGQIFFRTRQSGQIKEIDLNKIGLSNGAPELMADMNLNVEGDFAPHLRPYTFEENTALVKKNSLLFTIAGQRKKLRPGIEYGRCDKALGN